VITNHVRVAKTLKESLLTSPNTQKYIEAFVEAHRFSSETQTSRASYVFITGKLVLNEQVPTKIHRVQTNRHSPNESKRGSYVMISTMEDIDTGIFF